MPNNDNESVAKKVGHALEDMTSGVGRSAGGTVGVAGAGLSDSYNTAASTQEADELNSGGKGVKTDAHQAGKGAETAGSQKTS